MALSTQYSFQNYKYLPLTRVGHRVTTTGGVSMNRSPWFLAKTYAALTVKLRALRNKTKKLTSFCISRVQNLTLPGHKSPVHSGRTGASGWAEKRQTQRQSQNQSLSSARNCTKLLLDITSNNPKMKLRQTGCTAAQIHYVVFGGGAALKWLILHVR